MARVFNPPPGWPKPEEGWSPPPGWKPDPSWPEPPQGWDFWIDKADDVGSSLFGGSALGSSLFSARDDDTSIDSYGSVSPSGAAYIPGAPSGPDFTVSNREPDSMSRGGSQSSASAPSSPSSGSQNPYAQPGSGQSGGYAMSSTRGQGAGTQGEGLTASTHSPSATPGENPNAAPTVGAQGGGGMMVLGLLLIAAGVGLSLFSFFVAEPGEEGQVWWGLSLIGVFVFLSGLVRVLRSRAQRRQTLGQTGGGYSPSSHISQPGGGGDASGGLQTGHSSTVPIHNPNDPRNYKRR